MRCTPAPVKPLSGKTFSTFTPYNLSASAFHSSSITLVTLGSKSHLVTAKKIGLAPTMVDILNQGTNDPLGSVASTTITISTLFHFSVRSWFSNIRISTFPIASLASSNDASSNPWHLGHSSISSNCVMRKGRSESVVSTCKLLPSSSPIYAPHPKHNLTFFLGSNLPIITTLWFSLDVLGFLNFRMCAGLIFPSSSRTIRSGSLEPPPPPPPLVLRFWYPCVGFRYGELNLLCP
mmetsp:Transcript_21524/g.37044  ORF Transcript_21524/g.37044 Transcript_21524/m.37044 type:complete len:235 (+) Transcript_21524:514-1218(+)